MKQFIHKLTIAAGRCHTIGLKSDGTVVAISDNEYSECDEVFVAASNYLENSFTY